MKLKIKLPLGSLRILVPRVGLEPTHLAAGDFESPASTNFATWAGVEVRHFTDFYGGVKQYLDGDG